MSEEAATQSETQAPAEQAQPAPAQPAEPPPSYVWGTGRRKTAVARVRIRPGTGKILINKRPVEDYFRKEREREAVLAPLDAAKLTTHFDVWANVNGGGPTGQADAVKLGLARALVKAMPEVVGALREKGLLTRDPRMRERKKYGQKGARKRFQFSKR
jgi:small subunit ribosomal protein S9